MGLWDSVKKVGSAAVKYGNVPGLIATAARGDQGDASDPQGIYRNNGTLRVGKAEKLQLGADQARLQNDPNSFGLSDTEKDNMAAKAADTAGKQSQAAAGDLAQAALAGQGFQAGAFETAQRGLGEGAADAAVTARTGINDLHSRMVESAKQDVANRIHAERMSKKQEAQFWSQFAVDSTANLVAAVGEAVPG